MTAPLLSICVPTHHGRAREVGDLIASVGGQLDGDARGRVELCISDGASRDGTREIVERARDRDGLPIRYRRSDPDRGFTAHQHESVEMATAPYCWLMASDDAPAPGALARVLALLEAGPAPAALAVAFEVTDRRLEAVVDSPAHFHILPSDPARARRFSTRGSALEQLGLMFVCLSAQIVRRDAWLAAVESRARKGPLSDMFGHMQVIGEMLDAGVAWEWCPERLLLIRGDNDSWRPGKFGDDLVRYWRAHMTKIANVYAELWRGRWRSSGYRSCMARWRALGLDAESLMGMKLQERPPPSLRRDATMLFAFTRLFFFDWGFWRAAFPVLFLPHGVASRVRARSGR